jgi:hypothetical protein
MPIKVKIDAEILDTACSSGVINQMQSMHSAGLSFEFVVADMKRLNELKSQLKKQGIRIRSCSVEQVEDNV